MKKPAKYWEIQQILWSEVKSGKYSKLKKLPSEAQLVRRFKVSRPTVAKALQILQNEGLVQRKSGSGTFLKTSAKPRREHSDRQIGLLIPELGSLKIFATICMEFAGIARAHNFSILWGNGTAHVRDLPDKTMEPSEIELICNRFIRKRVAGVLFCPLEGGEAEIDINLRLKQALAEANIPLVLLDRDIFPLPQRSDLDVIGLDNFRAGYLVAEHLIKIGIRRIAFFSRRHSADAIDERAAGALAALTAHQIPLPKKFAFVGEASDATCLAEFATGQQFEAIICANDRTAARLLQALASAGIRVPHELRVVGVDDTRIAELLPVPLTTIKQPCRDIAVVAFQALEERMLKSALPARSLLITPQLVVRESCGAYRRKASIPAGKLADHLEA